MEIATCRNCGKIFNHIRGQLLCPTCQKELDGKFKEVKKYIYDHPKVGMRELSEECGVTVTQINRWIREERLCFAEDSPITINCESCGASIRTGRFCHSCKSKLSDEIAGAAGIHKEEPAVKKMRETKENKMRFLDSVD